MIRDLRKTLMGTALLLGATFAQAQTHQDPVDIGLFQNGSELEVRLRPSADFDGVVSAVVFTLRWETAGGGAISTLTQRGAEENYIPSRPSGGLHEDGPFTYQIYAGFGMEAMADRGTRWVAGKEYVVATIPVSGGSEFVLADDAWTKRDENNGAFYVSLGGVDHTGVIYKGVAGSTNATPFSITPNPSRGLFNLVIPVGEGENVSYEVLNSVGQTVAKKQLNVEGGGVYREEMDLTSSGMGTYHLRVLRNNTVETHKLVVH